jgi:hypothetical protein
MSAECHAFLEHLLGRARSAFPHTYLTLSAIHPDRQHAVPSRHIRLDDSDALAIALDKLLASNELGWGAFVAVGLRKRDLGRWRRGGIADVVALPALYVDIDAPAHEALLRLAQYEPAPSCILHSGGGVHAYWWLDTPTTELATAARVLGHLRQRYGGDALSVSQSMRLVGSLNTKPERANAPCYLHSLHETAYSLSLFTAQLQSEKSSQTGQTDKSGHFLKTSERELPPSRGTKTDWLSDSATRHLPPTSQPRLINPRLTSAIAELLQRHYDGYWRRSGWLAARCPCHHEHDLPGAHFSFKPEIGLGVCLGKHGKMLLKDLCSHLGLEAAAYGGLFV